MVIEFAANYTLPEITVTGYSGVEIVALREVTKGIDSISYLGDGRYGGCFFLARCVGQINSFSPENCQYTTFEGESSFVRTSWDVRDS